MQESANAMVQSTKPQTLSYGLNDSLVDPAAWIVEKFRAWSDCDGDVEKRFTKDELLTNLTIYWATRRSTHRAAFLRNYPQLVDKRFQTHRRSDCYCNVSKDLVPGRANGQSGSTTVRWTPMPRGGHFGEMEEPELLAEDIRAFFRPLRDRIS